jgi:hypothetical protein
MAQKQTNMGEGDESENEEEEPVVAAVDDIDSRDHLVIADVSRDDAWIAVPEGQAAALPASR